MSAFKAKVFAILSTAWGLFIFSNSLQTGAKSASASDSIVHKLIEKLSLDIDVDLLTMLIRKAAHISEYLLLGLLISLCFYYSKKGFKHNIFTVLFIGLSAGVLDEFIQTFVVGRTGLVSDVLIDFFGILLGFFAVYLVDNKKRKISGN